MIVTRLKLANLRAIEAAEFRFHPGFNLVVGVNGVGKTSVLDALGVCLSAVVKRVNSLRGRIEAFSVDDIRIGADALTVECGVRIGAREHAYLVHKPREASAPQDKKAGLPREQVHDTPQKAEFIGEAPSPVSGEEPSGRPLAVLFSTNRAVPSERAPGKGVAAGGVAAAFADAFANRELRLGEFGAWMRVQESMRAERSAASRVLAACEDAVARFLPGYSNLRLGGEEHRQLCIDRGATTIPVSRLSDGERGTLALVLDLTRRLAQANPRMADPAAEAAAIVLIDEIDLHLHPKWQRQVVHNLRAAFPQCQVIATTHSPQVIGEVEHERIQIIADGQVYSPTHSYGVDSTRVLEEVMGSDPRAKDVQDLLSQISRAIGRQQLDRARELLNQVIQRLGEGDAEVTRIRTLLDFVEGKE
jgi:predicted ATP-binding protein involved in virulence